MVMFLDPESVSHCDRLFLRKHRRSGISFFLRIIPVLVISRKLQIYLAFLQLALLDAEDICVRLL